MDRGPADSPKSAPERSERRRRRSTLAAAFVILVAGACGPPPRTGTEGLELTEVAPGSAFDRAGLGSGAVVREWRTSDGTATGRLETPVDLWLLEHDVAPRSPVEVRAGTGLWIPLGPGRFGVAARPAAAPPVDAPDHAGFAPRVRAWRIVEELAAPSPSAERGETGADEVGAGRRAATARLDDVVSRAEEVVGDDLSARSWIAVRAGRWALEGGFPDLARTSFERALEHASEAGHVLAASEIRYWLGETAGRAGDPAAEEEAHGHGLAIRRDLAPGSLAEARSWMRIGKTRATRDDIAGAREAAERALAITERQDPGGHDHANALMVLGIFHWFSDELDLAEGLMRRSQETIAAIDPRHEDVAGGLANLGIVAAARRDLAASDVYLHRALEAYEGTSASPLKISRTLNNLANNASDRRDLPTAERLHRRVLDLRLELAPESIDVATTLLNLGNTLAHGGRWIEAEAAYLRALEIQEQLVPGSRDVVRTLAALGEARRRRGEPREAVDLLRRGLALLEDAEPSALLGADLRRKLAQARRDAAPGDPRAAEEAERLLLEAAGILRTAFPETTEHALVLHALGVLRRETGRPEEAIAAFEDALAALEAQMGRLGGSDEARAGFHDVHLELYRDLVDLLLELGREEEAFGVLERSKARALLALLHERGVRLTASVAEPIRRELAAVDDAADRARERLTSDGRAAGVDEPARELEALEARRAALRDELRRALPVVGRLDPARTLSLEGALRVLPPGTVALAYAFRNARAPDSVERLDLFVLGPGERFRHLRPSLPDHGLAQDVERLRLLVERLPPAAAAEGHRRLARRLHEVLLAPAAAEIESAERIVVAPDGPLHLLPWAALVDVDGRSLVSGPPLVQVASLTVLAELATADGPGAPADERLAAFADPAGVWPRSLVRRVSGGAEELPPLPHGRREAERIAAFFGDAGGAPAGPRARVRRWVGPEASEARAKGLGDGEGTVHFATHGFVDPTSPLDSGLFLAPSTEDGRRWHDGLLQAWEVVRDLRMSADLVVLSACDTSGGPLRGGEGLLSLTRAFQGAGARSVLATLWKVRDRETAELMVRFYDGLSRGLDKAEALRRAQLAFAAEPATSHPYFWAGFQLYGAPLVLGRETERVAGAGSRPSR